jgi:hypothetical protein
MPNEKRAFPVSWSMPINPSERPNNKLRNTSHDGRTENGDDRRERHDREREVFGGPESQRN